MTDASRRAAPDGGDPACWLHAFGSDHDDIRTRDDVRRLVVGFYRDVATDELLGPIFEAAVADWNHHVDKLTAFWAWQLLGQPGYDANPLRAHEPVQARTPFEPHHYERWLHLFESAVNDRYAGPTAELAKSRARKMAAALARLLEGRAAPGADPTEVLGAISVRRTARSG